jgi:hypothetical protein
MLMQCDLIRQLWDTLGDTSAIAIHCEEKLQA